MTVRKSKSKAKLITKKPAKKSARPAQGSRVLRRIFKWSRGEQDGFVD